MLFYVEIVFEIFWKLFVKILYFVAGFYWKAFENVLKNIYVHLVIPGMFRMMLIESPSLHFPGICWRVVAIIRLTMLHTFFGNWLFFPQSRPEYFFCNTIVAKCKDDCALEYSPASLYQLWKIQVRKL